MNVKIEIEISDEKLTESNLQVIREECFFLASSLSEGNEELWEMKCSSETEELLTLTNYNWKDKLKEEEEARTSGSD